MKIKFLGAALFALALCISSISSQTANAGFCGVGAYRANCDNFAEGYTIRTFHKIEYETKLTT
ncbi:MAG: hypothetical protein LBH59_07365, partial [Planctomycetaceae bacterium]|nr:hypothetical protein [Planctomycetaceae bacterium]